VRLAIIGLVLLAVGALAVALGILPPEAVAELAQRVVPILLFVVGVTVVAELAAEAGLFRAIAETFATAALGRTWALWLLTVAFATACTIYLSLDTTAVLLTPIVISLATHAKLPPVPFALTTIWLANTGSLLLPISNLTNLLAAHQLGGMSPVVFASLTAAPALVAVLVPVLVIFIVHRRALTGRFVADEASPITDKVLFGIAAGVVATLIPALLTGIPVWIPALIAAGILVVAFSIRRRAAVRFALVPWQLLLFASGLFLVVEAAHSGGVTAFLASAVGAGTGPLDLLRVAGVGALSANAINNLPAYLAIEPFASDHPVRLIALLIGVNAGAIITPWASLATLLWHQRLAAFDVSISWPRFMLLGAVVAPITVVGATMALALVG
jgi:Na+/H+ antiporter NhaD/arsenite permease-like protein